jgi:hypothetical protein
VPTPLELAEDFTLYLPPRTGYLREVRDEYVLTCGNSGGTVARIRLRDEDVERAVDAVRARLGTEHVETVTWWCGEHTTPADLDQRLLALGLEPDDEAPTLASMLLDEPPPGEPTAEVKRVETFDDFRTAMLVDMDAWPIPPAVRARRVAKLEELWATAQEQGAVHYLGYLDGEPVAQARAFFLDDAVLLLGGACLPRARGRGIYFSLVHARWRDAVARGTPRLVVQAGPMSRPILERAGFRKLGEIRLLVDRLR